VNPIKQGGVVHQLEQQQQQQQQQRKEQEKKKKAAAAAAALNKAKESSQKGSAKKRPAKKSSTSFTAPDSSDSDSYSNSDSDEYNTANNNNKNSNSAANNDSGDSDNDWSNEHAEAYDDVEVDQTESEEPQSYLQQLRRTKALLQDEKLWLVSVFGPTVDPNSAINTVFGSSSDNSGYDNVYSSTAASQRRKVSSTVSKQACVMLPLPMILNANKHPLLCAILR
jgi:hypothetical protein